MQCVVCAADICSQHLYYSRKIICNRMGEKDSWPNKDVLLETSRTNNHACILFKLLFRNCEYISCINATPHWGEWQQQLKIHYGMALWLALCYEAQNWVKNMFLHLLFAVLNIWNCAQMTNLFSCEGCSITVLSDSHPWTPKQRLRAADFCNSHRKSLA